MSVHVDRIRSRCSPNLSGLIHSSHGALWSSACLREPVNECECEPSRHSDTAALPPRSNWGHNSFWTSWGGDFSNCCSQFAQISARALESETCRLRSLTKVKQYQDKALFSLSDPAGWTARSQSVATPSFRNLKDREYEIKFRSKAEIARTSCRWEKSSTLEASWRAHCV